MQGPLPPSRLGTDPFEKLLGDVEIGQLVSVLTHHLGQVPRHLLGLGLRHASRLKPPHLVVAMVGE